MDLKELLRDVRQQRHFDAEFHLAEKIRVINEFFTDEGLDAAVVGLSGGIDSSVVYKLLIRAAHEPGSPIRRVLGLIMPIGQCEGVTGQNDAMRMALLLENNSDKIGEVRTSWLGSACHAYQQEMDTENPSSWAIGQLASVVRTPHLYFNAAILQDQGFRSLVVGTTNRDEGSYIGFYGKASDGMVDLQPIADLHKSEVVKLARLLDVPSAIIDRTPVGDVWDGRNDEEMIGSPYWFLELYVLLMDYDISVDVTKLGQEDLDDFMNWSMNIELIRKTNIHKYKVGSPARYVDVLPRLVTHKHIVNELD